MCLWYISQTYLELLPENLGVVSHEHGKRFGQDISPWKSGTKARGFTLYWWIIAGQLEETFHGQNVT
jgi:hypothetical protein